MRTPLLAFALLAGSLAAEPRVDNVLIRMVPPSATYLLGLRVGEIRDSVLFRKFAEPGEFKALNDFARATGFDPRRDVDEVLFVKTKSGSVLLARGTFQLTDEAFRGRKRLRHGVYNIWSLNDNAVCVLDRTLAVMGDMVSVAAALDEWTAGNHTAGQAWLGHAKAIDAGNPMWGVATGTAALLGELPTGRGAAEMQLARVLQGLEDTWFEASFAAGFKGRIGGVAANEKDASTLRDAAKGAVGMGRLSVPQNQPELLKFWDGFQVEQQGRSVEIRIDVPQSQIDRLMESMPKPGAPKGPRA